METKGFRIFRRRCAHANMPGTKPISTAITRMAQMFLSCSGSLPPNAFRQTAVTDRATQIHPKIP